MDVQEKKVFDQYFKEKYQEFHNEVFDENGDDRAIIGYSFAWSAWQAAKAQAVPEGFVVVPMEPTEQILNRMTNTPIEVNHLCDNADIFLSEDEARIAYKAMIEAQEPAND